ncbi:hypothetical protein RD110_08840 [Rhodoferax koreense]|uniref:Uncharacterized protein n=1 Tax=Rhodoferax koreensis TaxID=1842727 RepID=A0A1P8JU40_9BURK|nr:hypothetical protein [Rhodoferax koreense]APW37286.1 hypothetical protein RD110_08840 [Rhodoferax koreense]
MEIAKQEVLSTLQRFDLMGMGCRVDDPVESEYALEAVRIARLVADGRPLRDAIIVTFDDHFYAGCLAEPERRPHLERLLHDFEQTPD